MNEEPTPLEAIVKAEIATSGPMTIHRYMELCLGHPEHGFYKHHDPFGPEGDFTTAPEISQMFGEMLGAWVATVWHGMGRPDFRLIELGPGRGTLMADMLRVLQPAGAVPEVWLVDTSPLLKAEQSRRVPGANWASSLAEVPTGPQIIVANEFFDALPVHQFFFGPEGAREHLMGLDADGELLPGFSAAAPNATVHALDWQEWSPLGDLVADQIAERLRDGNAAFLAIDYGYTAADRPVGPSLQALRANRQVQITDQPGRTDLTFLVDFDGLATRLAPLRSWVTGQGPFLVDLGIGHRAESLVRSEPKNAGAISDAFDVLTAPEEMGTLFKVLAAVSEGVAPPPGFGEGPRA
ncbi:MAG: SAM-dependent methyltransferase [Pseudomonadota bacterium]